MNHKQLKSAIDHRLSGLEGNPFLAQRIIALEKGEQPVVKKKISVSLILVLVLMMLTLSLAYALVQSNIAAQLYGREEAPQEVVEQIQQPEESAASALGQLTLDEILFDGTVLHTSLTIVNPTDEALLYTVDGIWLDGRPLTRSTLLMEGAGTGGVLLGGAVNGVAMPGSYSLYNAGDACYLFDDSGKYQGMGALPAEGQARLRISLAVWRPVDAPMLVDYRDYEGENVSRTLDCLVTDEQGYVNLELFRPEKYSLNATADRLSSDVYAQAYRALGWAELADRITLEMEINLSDVRLSSVRPTQKEYHSNVLSVTIDSFDLTHTGGAMEGWVYGDEEAVKAFASQGIYLADAEGNRVLNDRCWCDQPDGAEGMHFRLAFEPLAGDMPGWVYLAPFEAHNPRWDERSVSYNPHEPKPENVIGAYQLDLSRAIRMELE